MNRGARRSEQTQSTWVRCHPRCSRSRALAATRFCMDSSLCLPVLLSTVKSPLRCWEERALPADSARFPSTSLSCRLLSCKQRPEPPQTHADAQATARTEAQGKCSLRPTSSETLFPLPRQSGWLPTGLGWEDHLGKAPLTGITPPFSGPETFSDLQESLTEMKTILIGISVFKVFTPSTGVNNTLDESHRRGPGHEGGGGFAVE